MKRTVARSLNEILVENGYWIIAIVQFLLSFLTDVRIFTAPSEETITYYIFDKIVYLIVLVLIWRWVFLAIRGERSFARRALKYSILFGCIFLVCVGCIYPMIEYNGDMPIFMGAAKSYRLDGGLHWLTTLVWVLGYMMFPCEGGPTIIMALLSAIAFGYICAKMDDAGVNKVFRLLFLLPPVVCYSLYPTRMTTMSIVYMIYFTILYTDYIKQEKLNNKRLLVLLLISGTLSVWRLEGIYLLAFAPLFLIVAYRQAFNFKLYLKYFLYILVFNAVLSIPTPETTIVDKLHPIVGYMLPLMEMNGLELAECDEYGILNRYIDMEEMREKEEKMGVELYRADYLYALGVLREEPSVTKEEYVGAAVKVCLKHPIEYLETRLKVFTISANAGHFPFTGSDYVNEDGKIETIRENVLYLLNGHKSTFLDINNDSGLTILCRTIISWVKNFTWQLWTTVIIMVWLIIDTIKRKEWLVFSYTTGMWAYAAIVFLFSPATMFKYYWPAYTYVILIFIFYGIDRKDKRVYENNA